MHGAGRGLPVRGENTQGDSLAVCLPERAPASWELSPGLREACRAAVLLREVSGEGFVCGWLSPSTGCVQPGWLGRVKAQCSLRLDCPYPPWEELS